MPRLGFPSASSVLSASYPLRNVVRRKPGGGITPAITVSTPSALLEPPPSVASASPHHRIHGRADIAREARLPSIDRIEHSPCGDENARFTHGPRLTHVDMSGRV